MSDEKEIYFDECRVSFLEEKYGIDIEVERLGFYDPETEYWYPVDGDWLQEDLITDLD